MTFQNRKVCLHGVPDNQPCAECESEIERFTKVMKDLRVPSSEYIKDLINKLENITLEIMKLDLKFDEVGMVEYKLRSVKDILHRIYGETSLKEITK